MNTDYPYNPYYNRDAIHNIDMFFGRRKLLRSFYELLVNHQSVSLVGSRGVGKSSFLYCASLPEMQANFNFDLSRHIFVLLDLRKYLLKTSDNFFRSVSDEIIQHSSSQIGTANLSQGQGVDIFSNVLEQLQKKNFYLVLLFDAFDTFALNGQFDSEFYSFLRYHASSNKVSYVTATFAPLYELDLSYRNSIDSPIFNLFYTFSLGPLTEDEAIDLISVPSKRAGIPFTEQEIAQIRKEAGLHPFLIQRVCYTLFEGKRQAANGQVNLQEAKKLAYRDLLPYFNDIWQRLTESQHASLIEEAMNSHQLRELPELNESAFFRHFIHDKGASSLFRMSVEELEGILERMHDLAALGESNLRLMNIVKNRLKENSLPTPIERGRVIQHVLREALERMRGTGHRKEDDPEWFSYNILDFRYFSRYRMKHREIASRLGFSNDRQYYRKRNDALVSLLNVLLEMEELE